MRAIFSLFSLLATNFKFGQYFLLNCASTLGVYVANPRLLKYSGQNLSTEGFDPLQLSAIISAGIVCKVVNEAA
jgi:hypothetical protein